MLVTNVLNHFRYRQIFDLAVEGHRQHRPPSIAEVTRKLGRTASSVHDQVKRLQREGYIELVGESRNTRSLVPTSKGLQEAKIETGTAIVAMPVEAAHEFDAPAHSAACGVPSWADGTIERPTIDKLFPGFKTGDEVVYAHGYSMVDDANIENSIVDGDWVWVRPCDEPGEGKRVYVEYQTSSGEHECAIKKFEYLDEETQMVFLTSTNPSYPDVAINADDVRRYCAVMGRVHFFGDAR